MLLFNVWSFREGLEPWVFEHNDVSLLPPSDHSVWMTGIGDERRHGGKKMCWARESGILLMGRAAFHHIMGISGVTAMQPRISHRHPRGDVSHRGERTVRESVTVSFFLISLFLASLSSHTFSEITDVQSIALNLRHPVYDSPAASPENQTQWRAKQTGQGDGRSVCVCCFSKVDFSQKTKPQRMPDRGKF